jgi:hypothetical protein
VSAGREKNVKTWLVALVVLGLSLPEAALAGAAEATLVWAPRYTGKFTDYFPAGQTDLVDVTAKNGRVAKRCPTVGKLRGPRLKVKKVTPPSTSTSAFFAAFPDGDQIRQPATFSFVIDVEKLRNVGSRAAIELDTPFVPVGGNVTNFLTLAVDRQPDDSLLVFLDADGPGDVGTPLTLPADTPAVVGQLLFADDAVDATVKSCTSTEDPVAIGTDVPFVFDTSIGVGAGITGLKGDEAGIHLAISGNLYGDTAKRTALEDLAAIIALEFAAAQDLGNAMPTEAKAKLDQARALITTQGPEVDPPTKPATFRPALIPAVAALPASDANDEALKRLTKAAARDQKASDAIDSGTAKGVQKALKEIEKANTEKQRAKAVLETGVAAEAKF